jgi:hypothetical protein
METRKPFSMSPNLYKCCSNQNQPALFIQRDQEVNFQVSYPCEQYQDHVNILFQILFAEKIYMPQFLLAFSSSQYNRKVLLLGRTQ